jgi:hypothetical protein
MQESMKNQQVFAALSDDEPSWRQAMLEQAVEMTRLIDAIAFDILPGIYNETLNDDKTLEKVGRQDYNKAAMVGAKRLGVGVQLDERQQNIANMLQQSGGQATGMVTAGGKEMSLAEYKKQYNVSDKELKEVMRAVQINSVAAATKAAQPATTTAATPAGTKSTATATTTTPNATAAAPAAGNTQAAAATPGGASINLGQLQSILTTIQKEADTRGIIIAGKISTAYGKLVEINGNSQRVVARLDKIGNFTQSTSAEMKILNASVAQLKAVNEGIQKLLDAQVSGTEGNIRLLIDGKPVTRMIQRRAENNTGQDPTTTGGPDGG